MGLADHYHLAKKLKRISVAHLNALPNDPDWAVVMLFYSALHVTTAYLLNAGISPPTSHHGMREAIQSRPELGHHFRAAYAALSEFSWNVRYNPGFLMSRTNWHVASDRFRIVKTFVEPWVRHTIGLPPGSDL